MEKVLGFKDVEVFVKGEKVDRFVIAIPYKKSCAMMVNNVDLDELKQITSSLQKETVRKEVEIEERINKEVKELDKTLSKMTEAEQAKFLLEEILKMLNK